MDFPVGSALKNQPATAGDTGLIPGWRRSPEQGNGIPLQDSCLGNPMDRGAWQATVHVSDQTTTIFHCIYVPHVLYPFFCRWIYGCFHVQPQWTMRCVCPFGLWLSPMHAHEWDCWIIYGSSYPKFLRNLHAVLHSGYTNFHSHQQCRRFLLSMFSPAFTVCILFVDGHSDQYEVIPHCSFDLLLFDN